MSDDNTSDAYQGLGAGQMGGIGLIVLAIIAMAGYLIARSNKKSN